jgi:hypothetical protein
MDTSRALEICSGMPIRFNGHRQTTLSGLPDDQRRKLFAYLRTGTNPRAVASDFSKEFQSDMPEPDDLEKIQVAIGARKSRPRVEFNHTPRNPAGRLAHLLKEGNIPPQQI